MATAGLGVVVQVTLVDTSGLLAGRGKTSGLSVLVDRVADPVVSGISGDSLVRGVDQNNLKVLVSRVLVNPVGVEDTQVSGTAADTLLSGRLEGALVLELVDTVVSGLTVSGTLGHRSLSATSSDSNSEDDETLLGLVAQSSSLVGSGRSGGTVDDVALPVLPASDTVKETHHIGLLLALEFFQVFVGTHCI